MVSLKHGVDQLYLQLSALVTGVAVFRSLRSNVTADVAKLLQRTSLLHVRKVCQLTKTPQLPLVLVLAALP